MLKLNLSQLMRTLRSNFTFALPFVAGQIGIMLFGVCDVFVAGHHSQLAVAALGLASGLSAPVFMLGIGTMNAIAPLAAFDKGRGVERHVYFLPAMITAAAIGLLAWPLVLVSLDIYRHFNPASELLAPLSEYLVWLSPSIVFVYFFGAAKEYLQARGHILFANAAIILFNVLNLGLNVVLMFGLGPLKGLGVAGLGIATLITRLGLAIVITAYAWRVLKIRRQDWRAVELVHIKEILKLGLPLGIGVLAEVLVFATVTILIGSMETVYSAAHNIVLTLASLTFMGPLAISSVAAVKVAHARGENDWSAIAHHGASCALLSLMMMGTTALCYFLMPEQLIAMATSDEQLIHQASLLLLFVGLFQIPDGLQVTWWGALRGLSIARLPLVICLVCHWMIGLPLGYYLAFERGMKAQGLWIGLAVGLGCMALVLTLFWPVALKRQQQKALISQQIA